MAIQTILKKEFVLPSLALVIAIVLVSLFLFQPNKPLNNQSLEGLPLAAQTGEVSLADGKAFELSAEQVVQTVEGKKFAGYAYNGQFPGPLIKVKQDSKIKVLFKNNLPEPTTVHWHGLRLENRFDGVPEVTQKEVKPGESFEYELMFPDAGLFWYHPHVREDRQQEFGLYGTILVEPKGKILEEMREEVLVLDDLLFEETNVPEFGEKEANFAIMGRFGNVLLVNGKTDFRLDAKAGQPIRLYLLNAANARPFRFAIEDTKLKVIGGDAGFFGAPFFADNVTLGPSERAIVEVFFEEVGSFSVQNSTPLGTGSLGKVVVSPQEISLSAKEEFEALQENALSREEIEKFRPFFSQTPDFEYELLIRWPVMDRMMQGMQNGMPMRGMHGSDDGIEWEDSMKEINAITTTEEITWIIRDAVTKKENMDFFNTVKKGDVKKIRLKNLETSSHPMQHPIHLHGNRFLVTAIDGIPNEKLVWKDSVLVPTGKTVDLLVDFSNPGDWMIHCHIAEHLEAGMMSLVKVDEKEA